MEGMCVIDGIQDLHELLWPLPESSACDDIYSNLCLSMQDLICNWLGNRRYESYMKSCNISEGLHLFLERVQL
jgi:hypothetical protein